MIRTDTDISITDALLTLRPKASWTCYGSDYSKLVWHDENHTIPSKEEVENEITRLRQEWINNEYQRLRKKEYPSIEDQLDMLYNIGYDGWRSNIKIIKDKYPKSE